VLRRLTPITHPDLLVNADTGDDAAVWRWSDERALVLTTDFITPLVDDARTWGRIAAANAASDVYAMGGRPFLALNIVGWNTAELTSEVLSDVLLGAQDVGEQGGWVTAGGHTVDDPEPKFGLVVIGELHPDRMLTNTGLRPGQSLVLTKPLGVGVIATALKRGAAEQSSVDAAVASMVRLNDAGSAAALAAGATGATDITGFGLLGHLGRMAQESKVDVEVAVADVPLLPGARALAEAGYVPGGSRRNLDWVRDRLDADGIDDVLVALLADAQTSGGLLFGTEPAAAADAVTSLRADGHDAAVVGTTSAGGGTLRLRP
jgi:selenide,water dikinase